MLAVAALYVKRGRFRGQGGGADDNAWYPHKVGDIGGVEIADGNSGRGGM